MYKIFLPLAVVLLLAAGCNVENKTANQSQPVSPSLSRREESPTPKQVPTAQGETSNWKTYRNEKYGFEIKYPSNWHVVENPDSGDGDGKRIENLLGFCDDSGKFSCMMEPGGFAVNIFIKVENNPKHLSIVGFLKSERYREGEKPQKITIDDKAALLFGPLDTEAYGAYGEAEAWVTTNEYAYQIQAFDSQGQFRNILDTLRFTRKSTSIMYLVFK